MFSDLIFIMLLRSSQTLYFPTVCFKYMKYAWLFTFLQDCDKPQSCGHQGENISVDVLSVIFRCCTEALNVKHVVRVWLSHCVHEAGSLCEHELMFCCVMEKSLLTLFLWRLLLWCCLCGHDRWGEGGFNDTGNSLNSFWTR